MAAENRMYSVDETMKLIADKSKESDNFWIKVQRRAHPGATPTLVATLSGANVQHFASPELWIPVLCGGGKFLLLAYHETDLNRIVGGAMLFPVDGTDVRDVDFSLFDSDGNAKKAEWRGPARLEFPKAVSSSQQQTEMPMYGIRPPPAPGSGDSATSRQSAWPRPAGGGVHREAYDDYGNPLGQKAAGIEAERRVLEKEKLDIERAKHRDELDSMKKAHDAELRSMKAELLAEIRGAKQQGPDPMIEMFKQMSEDRRAAEARAAEDRRASEARAAEERKQQAEDRRASDARFERTLEKLTERKERDPLEVLSKAAEIMRPKGDDSVMMKTMHNMAEMQGSMVGAAMDFVEHASRMQLGGGGGEDEPKWLKGIERLLKGVGKMAQAAQARQPTFVSPPQPQIPSGMPPPPRGAQPPPPPPRPPQPQETMASVIEQIEQAIRKHHSVDEVAVALIRYYNEPTIQKALKDAGGDYEKAFMQRLGPWVNESPKNAEYLQQLFEAVQRQAVSAGLSVADTGDGDEEDEGDEDEE